MNGADQVGYSFARELGPAVADGRVNTSNLAAGLEWNFATLWHAVGTATYFPEKLNVDFENALDRDGPHRHTRRSGSPYVTQSLQRRQPQQSRDHRQAANAQPFRFAVVPVVPERHGEWSALFLAQRQRQAAHRRGLSQTGILVGHARRLKLRRRSPVPRTAR